MTRYGDDRAPLDYGTGRKERVATACPYCGTVNAHRINCVMKECVSCRKLYRMEDAVEMDVGLAKEDLFFIQMNQEYIRLREDSERKAQDFKDKCDRRGPGERPLHGPRGSDGKRKE